MIVIELLFIALGLSLFGLLAYAIARLFLAIVHRLERP